MASINETNEYSPSITKVDANNDVPNQQLANRTLYLKTTLESLQSFLNTYRTKNDTNYADLKNNVDKLTQTLKEMNETAKAMDEKTIISNLNMINKSLDELKTNLVNHTHNYAGSIKAGGDANSVDVKPDIISNLCAVGVTEAIPNKLRVNNKITFENDTISAKIFNGDLTGIAAKAINLSNNPTITLTGDVVGSVKFEGDKDVVINTSLKEQSVSAGEYGAIGNYTLGNEGSFTVPDITVNGLGLITKIRNRTISLPKNLGINGITSSLPTDKKIYILGTSEQAEKSATYTQNDVFIRDRHIYSNGNEVVNVKDFQNLKNKTYEGYELNDACARGVDETIGGSKDDARLITSNALYRHKHQYALSDSTDGRALYVKVTEDNKNIGYLVTNNYKKDNGDKSSSILTKNTNVYVQGKELHVPDMYAKDNMYIPGGKIWIDSIEVPVEEDAWIGNTPITEDTSEIPKKSTEVVLNPSFQGTGVNNPVSGTGTSPIVLGPPLSGLSITGGTLPDGSTTTLYTISKVTGGVKNPDGTITATKDNPVTITIMRDGKPYTIIATSGTFDPKKIIAGSTEVTYSSGGNSGGGITATSNKPIKLGPPLNGMTITSGTLPNDDSNKPYTISEMTGGIDNGDGTVTATADKPVVITIIQDGKPYTVVATSGTYNKADVGSGVKADGKTPIVMGVPLNEMTFSGGTLPDGNTSVPYTISGYTGGVKNADGTITATKDNPVTITIIRDGKPYTIVSTSGTFDPKKIVTGSTTINYVTGGSQDSATVKYNSGGSKTGNSGSGSSTVKITAGMLLVYKRNGYVPADNRSIDDCDNIALTDSDGLSSTIKIMYTGRYDLGSTAHDGDNCYVGQNGHIDYAPPTSKGTIVKKIGYVEGSFLVFYPSELCYMNK